jgi:hypothetical protein
VVALDVHEAGGDRWVTDDGSDIKGEFGDEVKCCKYHSGL